MSRTTHLTLAALALALAVAPRLPAALDPPHDQSQGKYCYDCHVLHGSPGGSLNSVAGNANLCESCHASIVDTDGKHFGFPWLPSDQAVPSATGRSHRWDAEVTSRGASMPPWVPACEEDALDKRACLQKRLDAGHIECSTCHDQHNDAGSPGSPSFTGGAGHVGAPNGATVEVGVPRTPTGGSGSGRMTLTTASPSATQKGYRVKITALPAGKVQFKISHDAGTSWFAWNGAWYADTTGTGTGREAPTNSTVPVSLDDGANVEVCFPSVTGYVVGSYWDFWISYPFLRVSNASDALCTQCHPNRVQSHTQIEGLDAGLPANGATVFSHPVGEPLDTASGLRATPLDADGATSQLTGDGNPTNDIVLDGNVVRCTSCHAVHNADSNSLTVDAQ